jgi:hypothetical protein
MLPTHASTYAVTATQIFAQQNGRRHEYDDQGKSQGEQDPGLAVEDEDAGFGVEAVEGTQHCGQAEEILLG